MSCKSTYASRLPMLLLILNKLVMMMIEVNRISASVSAPNVDKWALSADIRFRPKAVVPHSVHFRFQHAAVDKFGGCQKSGTELRRQRM